MASRWTAPDVQTPALVVDLAACERNVDVMAGHARSQGLALRPHAKTHKAPALAARQVAAGATGITVATLGEAEVFADHAIGDLFVAYPLWAVGDVGTRLGALLDRAWIAVGADSIAAVERLRREVGSRDDLRVLVEVDCGLRRSGIAPTDAATVGKAISDAGFELGGVFTFPGHSYGPGMPVSAREDEERALAQAAHSFDSAGLPCPVRSGGSTPTAATTTGDVVSELRPGVYVFNDAQQVALGTCPPTAVALAAIGTVVSVPAAGRVVLDAGAKVLGPDRPPWVPGHGLLLERPAARVTGLWEHHAVVDVSATAEAGVPALRVGDRVAVAPNHVCTAVNLARELHVLSGGSVVGRWQVAAAGANR